MQENPKFKKTGLVQSTLALGHPITMDTRYYGQNPALHLAKATEVWLKMTRDH